MIFFRSLEFLFGRRDGVSTYCVEKERKDESLPVKGNRKKKLVPEEEEEEERKGGSSREGGEEEEAFGKKKVPKPAT